MTFTLIGGGGSSRELLHFLDETAANADKTLDLALHTFKPTPLRLFEITAIRIEIEGTATAGNRTPEIRISNPSDLVSVFTMPAFLSIADEDLNINLVRGFPAQDDVTGTEQVGNMPIMFARPDWKIRVFDSTDVDSDDVFKVHILGIGHFEK